MKLTMEDDELRTLVYSSWNGISRVGIDNADKVMRPSGLLRKMGLKKFETPVELRDAHNLSTLVNSLRMANQDIEKWHHGATHQFLQAYYSSCFPPSAENIQLLMPNIDVTGVTAPDGEVIATPQQVQLVRDTIQDHLKNKLDSELLGQVPPQMVLDLAFQAGLRFHQGVYDCYELAAMVSSGALQFNDNEEAGDE